MEFTVIKTEDLQKILQTLEEIKEAQSKHAKEDFSSSYIPSKEVPKLLDISQKTWQTYRDKKIVPFIQLGSKIWVKRSDLEAFLNRHYITSNTTQPC